MTLLGTGGAPKYGVVSQFPVAGEVVDLLYPAGGVRAQNDTARVGYYRTKFLSNITTEIAASDHAAVLKYTFPSKKQSSIIVDLSHYLPSSRGKGMSQFYKFGNITIAPNGQYEGYGVYNNSWNRSPDWKIFFCGQFNKRPTSISTFSGPQNISLQSREIPKSASGADRIGALFSFGNGAHVESRVAISWISSAKACQFIKKEIPPSMSFKDVVSQTRQAWNDQVLSKIRTKETDTHLLRLLYTSLYGMFLTPTNRTGENPKWKSDEPYFDDILTLWDTYRTSMPLMHVLHPVAYEQQIRSLIDIWRHDGYMPDARSSNHNGRVQGGTSADNVLADAFVKGVRGSINWEDGYKAMVKNAEVAPEDSYDPLTTSDTSSTKEGRGALPDWLHHGFITTDYSRSVSRAVEYSMNDFSLAQVAEGLSKGKDKEKYLKRSKNWRNHWSAEAESLGFHGFFMPRLPDGSFYMKQNPVDCGGCYWGSRYYEATPWEYSFGVLHDVATLVSYNGGTSAFSEKLSTLFAPGKGKDGGTIFDPGNEPSFASPYLFNFADRQDLTVKTSRFIARKHFNDTAHGLPGNSDGGAMQSWLLWNMIGLYPLTGQATFLIASPWFEDLTLTLGDGKTLRITKKGGSIDEDFYVQSLKVNGRPWNKSWISWQDIFADGGVMEFICGPKAKHWATGDLPPSPAFG